MRPITRGAAAVAALAAGALVLPQAAFAVDGSDPFKTGGKATEMRVAGKDRVQTSLAALETVEKANGTVNVIVVGYNGSVDALSLPPLAKQCSGDFAVVYAMPDGLDGRVLGKLGELQKAGRLGKLFIAGGTGAVPASVEGQLYAVKGGNVKRRLRQSSVMADVVRLNGKDRFETSYLAGAFGLGNSQCTKLATDLAVIQYREYLAAELPKLEKEFYDARDKWEAAQDAELAALKARDEARAKFVAEVEALGVTGTTVDHVVAQITDPTSQYYVQSEQIQNLTRGKGDIGLVTTVANSMGDGKTSQALKMVKDFVDYAESNFDTIKLPEGVTADQLKQALANVRGADFMGVAPQADHVVADANSTSVQIQGLMNAQNKAIVAAVNGANHVLGLAKLILELQNNEVAKAALKDPNSAVGKAAKAVADTDKAYNDAVKATSDAYGAYVNAYTYYHSVWNLSFDNFKLRGLWKDFNDYVAGEYAKGNVPLVLATGMDFADALTAGPAAASVDGVIVLTNNNALTEKGKAIVAAGNKNIYAVGGQAAAAAPLAKKVVGKDRYATSVAVAKQFFPNANGATWAVASGQAAPDAVIGGVLMTTVDKAFDNADVAGVLLTMKNDVPASVAEFVQYGNRGADNQQRPVGEYVIIGGEGVVSRAVANELTALTHN